MGSKTENSPRGISYGAANKLSIGALRHAPLTLQKSWGIFFSTKNCKIYSLAKSDKKFTLHYVGYSNNNAM